MKTTNRLALLASALLPAACTTPPLRPVKHVDVSRYMGDWRVIANIPYFAERGCVDTIESYALRPDGKIDNWFTYRRGGWDKPVKKFTALAWIHDQNTNAEWRVRFLPLVTAKYFIIDLDPEYRWAVVGHPSRNYGWIMARGRTMPEKTYQEILSRLKEQGYDPARFEKVSQVPLQP